MKNGTKNIIKYLIEFLIVAFGVFLGIYASEWENQKKIKESKEKAIENIVRELNQNKENLQNSIEYHELIKTNLDSILRTIPQKIFNEPFYDNKKFKFNSIQSWKGNGFTRFENTAFEVAKMSGTLQNMNIDLIQDISKIYNQIKFLSDYQSSLTERTLKLNSETKTIDVIIDIKLITGDNIGMEKNVLAELNQAINRIKTTHNGSYEKR